CHKETDVSIRQRFDVQQMITLCRVKRNLVGIQFAYQAAHTVVIERLQPDNYLRQDETLRASCACVYAFMCWSSRTFRPQSDGGVRSMHPLLFVSTFEHSIIKWLAVENRN